MTPSMAPLTPSPQRILDLSRYGVRPYDIAGQFLTHPTTAVSKILGTLCVTLHQPCPCKIMQIIRPICISADFFILFFFEFFWWQLVRSDRRASSAAPSPKWPHRPSCPKSNSTSERIRPFSPGKFANDSSPKVSTTTLRIMNELLIGQSDEKSCHLMSLESGRVCVCVCVSSSHIRPLIEWNEAVGLI